VNPKGSALPLDLFDAHFREIRIGGAFGRGTTFRRALAPSCRSSRRSRS
jgi:hypothetical protein